MVYEFYTDGACSRNPGPGGWASILPLPRNGKVVVLHGGYYTTTNNKMELTAIIEALKFAGMIYKQNQDDGIEDTHFVIYSDSSYCVNMIQQKWIYKWCTNGWRTSTGEPVKNAELVEEFAALYQNLPVELVHVKGHADNYWNNKCDEYARGVYTSRKFDSEVHVMDLSEFKGGV